MRISDWSSDVCSSDLLERSLSHTGPVLDEAELPEPRSNVTRERFFEMVEIAREYVHAGAAFQIVPSQRFALDFELPPFALYRSLRRLNPSPFLFFLDFGDFAVVGSSPEIDRKGTRLNSSP